MRIASLAIIPLIFIATPAASSPTPMGTVAAALKAPDRRPDNVKLDEGRKPAEVLQFLGLAPGMKVLDLFGANGYWAEIMVPVIGPKGHVTVWQPTQFYRRAGQAVHAMASSPSTTTSTWSRQPFEAPNLPKNYADFVILNNNYHDTYWTVGAVQNPEDGPDRVSEGGLCGDEAGRGDRRDRSCRQYRTTTFARRSRNITGSTLKSSRPTSSAPGSCSSAAATCCATRPTITASRSIDPKIRGQDRPVDLQVQEAALTEARPPRAAPRRRAASALIMRSRRWSSGSLAGHAGQLDRRQRARCRARRRLVRRHACG